MMDDQAVPDPRDNSTSKIKILLNCQTPDLDQDLSLGVDFVFPLEQEPPHQSLPEGC